MRVEVDGFQCHQNFPSRFGRIIDTGLRNRTPIRPNVDSYVILFTMQHRIPLKESGKFTVEKLDMKGNNQYEQTQLLLAQLVE